MHAGVEGLELRPGRRAVRDERQRDGRSTLRDGDAAVLVQLPDRQVVERELELHPRGGHHVVVGIGQIATSTGLVLAGSVSSRTRETVTRGSS
jgi:hypothetical protein